MKKKLLSILTGIRDGLPALRTIQEEGEKDPKLGHKRDWVKIISEIVTLATIALALFK